MTGKERARFEELERRVKELEARPQILVLPAQPYPAHPQPYYPPPPYWVHPHITWTCGNATETR